MRGIGGLNHDTVLRAHAGFKPLQPSKELIQLFRLKTRAPYRDFRPTDGCRTSSAIGVSTTKA